MSTLRLRQFKQQERRLFDDMRKRLSKRTSNPTYQRRVMLESMDREAAVEGADPWTTKERVYVGSLLYTLVKTQPVPSSG